MTEQELIEALADKEHDSWSHWQAYLFSRCDKATDGSLIIPAALVKRWQRQIATPYEELTEQEKQSDRNEVAQILPLIHAFTQQQNDGNEDRERLIRNIIVWNLDLNRFDDDDCETELVKWVLETAKQLNTLPPEALPALQHANSLAEREEESEAISHE